MRNSTQQKAMHTSRTTRVWLALIIGLAGVVGGHHFQRMLSAIPDSNDDFIFF